MEKTLAYLILNEGGVDALVAYKTDGLLSRFPLRLLEDNLNLFPPYDLAPVMRRELIESHPEVREVIDRLSGRLSDAVMQQLNDSVERGGRDYKEVAASFLRLEKLV